MILGSGLGEFANEIEIVDTISYNDIEGYPMQDVVLPTRLMGMMGATRLNPCKPKKFFQRGLWE